MGYMEEWQERQRLAEKTRQTFEASYVGKFIDEVRLNSDRLEFSFTDGSRMAVEDDGQSCCEVRYMTCDDDLSYYSGAEYLGYELRDVSDVEDPNGDSHDIQFLAILTNRGEFVLASHNEHNGCYSGFSIQVKAL
jgi:hypothetical protein